MTIVMHSKIAVLRIYLILAAMAKLLEDVTGGQAEVLRGQEIGTRSDQAAVSQRCKRSPLSIHQAASCACNIILEALLEFTAILMAASSLCNSLSGVHKVTVQTLKKYTASQD